MREINFFFYQTKEISKEVSKSIINVIVIKYYGYHIYEFWE